MVKMKSHYRKGSNNSTSYIRKSACLNTYNNSLPCHTYISNDRLQPVLHMYLTCLQYVTSTERNVAHNS